MQAIHKTSAKLLSITQDVSKERIGISTSTGIEIIEFTDIVHCQAEGNYCRIKCRGNREVLSSKTLKSFEAILPKSLFQRVHQSHIIAMEGISKIQQERLWLEEGIRIPISRSRRADLMKEIHRRIAVL